MIDYGGLSVMDEPKLDDANKIAVTSFEPWIANTFDHVWYGVLKREYWDKKHTVKGWFSVLADLKKR
jgi:hypothetical protein